MKKFRLITALTLALLLVLGTPLSAMAASWDVTDSQGVYDAFSTDTDAEVIINMQNDINMDHYLTAGTDQSYTINGNGHTISDVVVEGEGSVEINADVTSEDAGVALDAMGGVEVTVNGDVSGDGLGLYAGDAEVTVNGDLEGGMSVYDGSDVTINGDVTSEDGAGIYASESDVTVNGDVSAEYNGVTAMDGANVTVEGNVTSEESGGVYAYDAEVSVTGDITAEYGGVSAQDGATVTVEGNIQSGEMGIFGYGEGTTVDVTGDVSGEYGGVYAGEGADVTVEGDVSANDGSGITAWDEGTSVDVSGDVSGITGVSAQDGAEVTVTGDVTAETKDSGYAGEGIYASNGATVTVNGDVAGADAIATDEELQDPGFGEWGGDGVVAYGATVTVNGNVTGGDGVGTAGNGGTGVYTENGADVTVNGNVTGGDVVADPDVEPYSEEVIIDEEGNTETYYWNTSSGGEGVTVSNTSNVTVNGNVTGGNTNGNHGEGGHAIWLNNYGSVTDGEYGTLTVTGTAAGGKGGEGGEGGAALFFNAYCGYLPSEDPDLEAVLNTPVENLTEEDCETISYLITYALNEGLLDFDALIAAEEALMAQITEDMTEDEIMALYYGAYQKLAADHIPDLDAVQINGFVDVTVGTLSDENGPKLDSSAGQEAAEKYAKEMVTELAPTGSNPRTGDDFSGIFVVLMVASALGMVALVTQRKRFA